MVIFGIIAMLVSTQYEKDYFDFYCHYDVRFWNKIRSG